MDLSVVLLSYNTRDLLEQALHTVVEAAAGLEVEIFVVDNASHDGSADMVAASFPQVKLIRNRENIGFSAGNNIAFEQVRGRHVLVLNSDTIVRRDTLRCLVQFLDEHPDVGAVGCKILNPDGTLQPDCMRGFPTPMAAFCKVSGLSRLFPQSPRFARYNMTYLDPEKKHEVEVLSGSCMMVRKQTMDQVGMLDEDYFMYGEDIDWCFRMHSAGWKICYLPDTEIIHFRGESGRAVPMRVLYRKTEAMSIFVGKHMQRRYRFFPLWLLHLGIVLHGLFSLFKYLGKKIALPLLDGILLIFGLKLGLAVRFHAELVPLIHTIENLSARMGVEAFPTRWPEPPPYTDVQWFFVYLVPLLTWLAAFYLLGLYERHKFSAARTVVAVALGFAAIITMVFFFKDYNFSRLAAGAAWGLNTLLVAGWRVAVQSHRGRQLVRRRILLVGTDVPMQRFLEHLEQLGGLDYEVVGLVGQDSAHRGGAVAGRQVIGLVDELQQLVQEYAIDELIFTTGTVPYVLENLGKHKEGRALRIRMVPEAFTDLLGDWAPTTAEELPLIEISTHP